jgi:hypothetical protein
MKIGDKVQYTEYGEKGAKGVIIKKAFCVRYELPDGRIVEHFALPENLTLLSKESEERLPCGHPVTDDYAYNDPNPGATHFCVSCAKESKE